MNFDMPKNYTEGMSGYNYTDVVLKYDVCVCARVCGYTRTRMCVCGRIL